MKKSTDLVIKILVCVPRALPWAGMLRPFRAKNALKSLNEIKCNFFVLHPVHVFEK